MLKILALFEACHCGPAQGARIRALKTLEALSEISEVTLVLISRYLHDKQDLALTRENTRLAESFTLTPSQLSATERIRHEINPYFLNTHRTKLEPQQQNRILELADENDLLWFHTIVPANCANILDAIPAVLDIDDLLSTYYSSISKHGSFFRKLLNKRMSILWRRQELVYQKRFPSLAVCSEEDKKILGNRENVTVIPNGFDPSPPRKQIADRDPDPTIGFIGNLKYVPNSEGLQWFINNVWPNVRNEVPNCKLRISGSNSHQFLSEQHPEIIPTGWIKNLKDEMRRWWLTIVPIHTGSGTRIKIATAYSLRCPVVSTTLGAYGYNTKMVLRLCWRMTLAHLPEAASL